MKIEKFIPVVTKLKNGKQIKRFDMPVQKSTAKYVPDINIGITPSGTRYYRALLPDKSWGTTYMVRKDGTETIVDICRMSYGTKASVESSKDKIILSDRMIEHHSKDSPEVLNVVSKDQRLKKVARAFVQPEVLEYMFHLKKAPGYEAMKPPKPQPVKKFFLGIKKLFVSQCINRFQ